MTETKDGAAKPKSKRGGARMGRRRTGNGSPTSKRLIDAHDRVERAAWLRSQGWTWQQIADSPWPLKRDPQGRYVLDDKGDPIPVNKAGREVPLSEAGRMYNSQFAAHAAVNLRARRHVNVERYREEVDEWCDELIAGNMADATSSPDSFIRTAAIGAVRDAIDRKIKVYGLAQPEKHELTGKDGEPLQTAPVYPVLNVGIAAPAVAKADAPGDGDAVPKG
jgi:hypothetical protein